MAEQTGAGDLVLDRTFDAPLAVMWEMWTDPVHFGSWYGPVGATVTVAEMDVRVGGARRVRMEVETPDGPMSMWFVGEHLVVAAPDRLVYTESIGSADGQPLPGEAHPITRVEVDLRAVDGGTRVVMTHHGVPASSPGAGGWSMAFDKLGAVLSG